MKKKFSIFIVAMAMAFGAAAQVPEQLDAVTKSLSAKCPADISDGLRLERVIPTDSTVIFEYTISDDLFANITELGGILHDSLLAEFVSSPDENTQRLLEACKSAKIRIIQRFNDASGKNFDIIILPEEL